MTRSERSALQEAQRIRKRRIVLMGLVLLPLPLVVASAWPPRGLMASLVEGLGALLILSAIAGRCWCTLHIGGRKRAELVTDGPYSIMRHPLYVFTLLGLVGAGMQTGSLLLGLVLAVAPAWPLYAVALQEEEALHTHFGEAYQRYRAGTPAFLPRLALWREPPTVEVRPALVRRTFLEAALVLVAVPLGELIKGAQLDGLLPVLLRLP